MNRRTFFQRAGAATLGSTLLPNVVPAGIAPALEDGTMKITKIEAIRFKSAHWMWVKLYTDKGIVGLGETYPFSNAEIGALKDLSHVIIGKDPRDIEGLWKQMYTRATFNVSGGTEMRIISAVNIAQWDLLGKYLDAPLYRLLGGKAREAIRVYNTTRGIGDWTNEKDIEKIARFLLDRGVKAMKIWPFDPTARKNGGAYITPLEIEANLDWFKRIRDAVGREMEIGVEFHAYWNLPSSQKIAEALEPYEIMWLEDIMFPENTEAYSKLAAETSIPLCVSERLATRYPFLNLLKAKAIDIAMFDVTWCGGLTSAKKIADLADAFMVPSAPHTYGGPGLWYASAHLAMTLTNLWIMESGYYFYNDRYPDYLEDILVPVDGLVTPPDLPGLGMKIKDSLYTSGEAIVETIAEV